MTDQQELSATIAANEPRRLNQIISEAYYRQKNTEITNRKKLVVTEAGTIEHPYISNKKLKSGFAKVIVDQKVNYSINTGMTVAVGGKDIADVWGENWYHDVRKVATDAAKKGFGIVQFYLEGSTVKYKKINPEQCILCYDDDNRLRKVIRQYTESNEKYQVVRVAEIYTADTKSVYKQVDGSDWVCNVDKEPILVSIKSIGNNIENVEATSWGMPPFAVFQNNEYFESDVIPVKVYIDEYDFVLSDFGNNIEDNQEDTKVLKNYGGEPALDFIRKYKSLNVIKVDDDGEVSNLSTPIHTEAKTKMLEIVRSDIFEFAMAVDMKTVTGTTTATEIESKYTNLNNKASEFEGYCTEFIEQVVGFYLMGQKFTGLEEQTPEVEVNYVRQGIESIKTDEKIRLATLSNQSIGSVSEKTRLGMNPFVIDVEEEMAEIDKESGVNLV